MHVRVSSLLFFLYIVQWNILVTLLTITEGSDNSEERVKVLGALPKAYTL